MVALVVNLHALHRDQKRMQLVYPQMMMDRTTKLQEDDAPAEEAPADAEAPASEEAPVSEGATPMKEPGFVIATTDDSSPPPVTEGTTFHHVKVRVMHSRRA